MKRLIYAEDAMHRIEMETRFYSGTYAEIERAIDTAPTVDAVEVVRCGKCVLHGNCCTEDAFIWAGIENPFCCAGKRKEGAD